VGRPQLTAQKIMVPGDISSAAFPIVAALIHPGSDVTIRNVGMNTRRNGIITTLLEMGGDITLMNERIEGGEPVVNLRIRGSTLHGIIVPPERAASMIDEYPILAMAAACAVGSTKMLGLHELRVKESDRLTYIAEGLYRAGALIEMDGDNLIVNGTGEPPPGGGQVIETAMDHRIAMSFLVLGSATPETVTVDDGSFIATSFPGFTNLMNGLGMEIG
jgi:3-phosphoshikimate 1-carboxyvinyltransferase